jgi:hypothetical protein
MRWAAHVRNGSKAVRQLRAPLRPFTPLLLGPETFRLAYRPDILSMLEQRELLALGKRLSEELGKPF